MSDLEGFVPVVGGRLWAQAAGEGTGVVLAHAGIADARMWDPQWAALAARHRVVRYDLRGFGRADVEATTFSNRADMVAVMDAAGLDRAVLVGCSRAGAIIVDTALEFPDRVSGLAWVCGGLEGVVFEGTPDEQAAFAREEALAEAKDWPALADLMVEIWIDGLGQPSGRAPAEVRDLVRRMCLETDVGEKPYGDPIALEPPAVGRLAEIRVPLLAIVGELDPSSTAAMADVLVGGVPRARRIDLPGVAHLPSLERPDWFTETLLGFLAEVG
jgi:pimeloyl-ACP methyl ester carboxylesterase